MIRIFGWLFSLGVHGAALFVLLVLTGNVSLPSGAEDLTITDEEIAAMMPSDEPPPAPEIIEISPVKVLVDHGGRNELERRLFKEFAEGGGLVGSTERMAEGPKVRFGHTMFTKYQSYSQRGVVGHYRTKEGVDVFVLDARTDPRIGRFLLHAPAENFTRALTKSKGSRYIFSYGETLLASEPVAGSVMFFADGKRIHQILWMPKNGQARYPLRVSVEEGQEVGQSAP